jgi:uncharacterized protein YjiS (DUF1127 family)
MLAEEKMEPNGQGFAGKLAGMVSRYMHRVAHAVTVWQERAELERELMSLDDAALADLGLVRGQIRHLVAAHPSAATQLDQMLTRIGLSEEAAADHQLHDDLYRTCIMCTERTRCRNWLASAKGRESYRAFCPNRWVFDRMLAARGGATSTATH